MRIGLFTDQYLPNISGVVTSIQNLRRGLEALGHEVYIIAPSARRYKDNDDHVLRVFSVDPRVFQGNVMAIPTIGILKKLVDLNFDVVHVQEMMTIGTLGHAVAKKTGCPLIFTVHTQWDELFRHYPAGIIAAAVGIGIGFPLYFGLKDTLPVYLLESGGEKTALRKQFGQNLTIFANACDAVIAPSMHVLDKLDRFKCKTRVIHVPNSIDTSPIVPEVRLPVVRSTSIKVVCVGRVSSEKRTEVLIRSFIKLPKEMNAELFILGDGPDLDNCTQIVEASKSTSIHFLGMQSNERIRELLLDADLLVLASNGFDNQPMVILEALAAGVGILYCDPQLKDGLTNENSFLSGPSVQAFTKSLNLLLQNERLLDAMGKASLKLSKNYSSNTVSKQIEGLYLELIDEKLR